MQPGPLAGRTVVVTRSGPRARDLVDALERAGATALELPLTRQVDPSDGGAALRAAAAEVQENRWVVLTSVNAVERFVAELRDARALGPVLVAAVGPATADALRMAGVEPDLVPAEHSARGLVEEFPPSDGAGRRVLFPCADLSPDTIVEGLGQKGWEVRRVEAYRTVARSSPEPELLARVAAADAVSFTATSSVAAFGALADSRGCTAAGAPARRLHRAHHRRGGPVGRLGGRARGLGLVRRGHRRRAGRPLRPRCRHRLVGWTAMAPATPTVPAAGDVPDRRLRRLRRTPALRRLVAEARLGVDDLVAPLFVREGTAEPTPIASMPGQVQHTLDSLVPEAKRLVSLGIPGLILFGVPARKDARGSGAWDPDGVVQRALRAVRDAVGDELVVMADLCLDEYTDHGHCGVLGPSGEVLNDETLELYQRIAVAQADAGADVVAPSGMMDGQVAAIRAALDGSGHDQIAVLAYAAKYASALYGPFRDAVDVTIAGGGDRRAYQQDPRNGREALAEIEQDLAEGADMIMVKPAMTSLDVLAAARGVVRVPLAAYHVSGEYSMIKAAAAAGWIDGPAVALEQLTVLKRAGADFVLTYFATEVAEALGG